MTIEEWVQYALQAHGYDIDKARQHLAALGELNPTPGYYEGCCAIAARERWADLLRKVDINRLSDHELDLMREMGPLWNHLRPEDAMQERLATERRYRTLHPRQFMGFKEKRE